METRKHGDTNMEKCRYGDMDMVKGDMETWTHGDMDTWRHGDGDRDMGTWN
jgi:hypothetical protein